MSENRRGIFLTHTVERVELLHFASTADVEVGCL